MEHVASWFQAALLPRRWLVAGVSCHALSLWHVYVLCETGNAYAVGGCIDLDAATALLLYCSRGYANGRRLFLCPFYRRRAVTKIARTLRKRAWSEVDAAISDYLSTCRRAPGHKERAPEKGKAAQARRASAPVQWALVEYLVSSGHARTLDAAWDTPYSVARCLFDAKRDICGDDDSLESPEEEARFDAAIARKKGAA